jgi:hypothetical protein
MLLKRFGFFTARPMLQVLEQSERLPNSPLCRGSDVPLQVPDSRASPASDFLEKFDGDRGGGVEYYYWGRLSRR